MLRRLRDGAVEEWVPHRPPGAFSRKREKETDHSMRSTPPMYGRNTSGTVIEPSGFW